MAPALSSDSKMAGYRIPKSAVNVQIKKPFQTRTAVSAEVQSENWGSLSRIFIAEKMRKVLKSTRMDFKVELFNIC